MAYSSRPYNTVPLYLPPPISPLKQSTAVSITNTSYHWMEQRVISSDNLSLFLTLSFSLFLCVTFCLLSPIFVIFYLEKTIVAATSNPALFVVP